MSINSGTLYIVATPIGNLEDFSPRAVRILKEVDLIAAEDTRHSQKLLNHFGINTKMRSYHDFSRANTGKELIKRLMSGEDLALISDAGTPLISDPGYKLVKTVHKQGIKVVPVPGPSSLISALSVAGLPTDRFIFEGFAPEKQAARRKRLESLREEERTLVFFESPHRIMAFLEDAVAVFGPERPVTLAREITKIHETIHHASLETLYEEFQDQQQPEKGEFVAVIAGTGTAMSVPERETDRVLALLLDALPVKQAAALAARITGGRKNEIYQRALELQGKH